MEKKNYFQYNNGEGLMEKDAIRLSPSQLSRFFDSTHQWWSEQIYGEAPEFTGNTATELGTCVHAAAAMYFDTSQIDVPQIEMYIDSIDNTEVDKQVVRAQWKAMAQQLINGFLTQNKGTESEIFVQAEIVPGIVAAGSIDMYDETRKTIVDFKTMNSLDTARLPTNFPRSYWFQQMTYAWIQRQNGKPVDWLKLVYVSRNNVNRISPKTGKAMKDYPSEVNVLTHKITNEDMEIIESSLRLMAESVQLWKDHPEYRHIICQDMRRKEKAKPVLFKD